MPNPKKKQKIKGEAPQRLARLRSSEASETNFRAAATNDAVDVYLYDVIGWPFIEAQDLLYQVPQNAKTINVHINSPGGDVFEGMAIYNYLTAHKAKINVSVEALAASSASLIAMAGNNIRMAGASFLMIHNPWSMMAGDADELRKEADLLDKIGDVFASAYAEKSGTTKQDMLDLMREETWFTPDEAVAAKLANEIMDKQSGGTTSAAEFDLSVFANVPENLRHSSASRQARTQNTSMEEHMDKKLRALLERLGLSAEATDEQAWSFLAEVDPEKIQTKEDQDRIQAALDRQTEPSAGSDPEPRVDPEKVAREAIAAERKRVSEIKEAVRIAGLDNAVADDLIERDASVDQARQAIFAKMKETNPPIGAGRIQVGEHDQDKFRAAVTDGMCMRAGVKVNEAAPGSKDFRAAPLHQVARVCLERAGVDTRSLMSPKQLASAILKHSRRAEMSTDDFSSIFLDVQNKRLNTAFQEAKRTFLPLVTIASASDFKTQYGVTLSEAPDLDPLTEHDAYKEAKFKDKQESYAVKKYGKIAYLTLEMIVNDDLRSFVRIPQLFGAAAARKESDIVWALITGNPTMSEDSKTLFHADHNNLETVSASKGSVSPDRISRGRQSLRTQTGLQGATLNLTPSYLLLPSAQETDGEILVRSTTLPKENMPTGSYNFAQSLVPICDSRLDKVSVKSWYLAADPSQIDIIEMAYMDGEQQPYTEEETVFDRDAMGYKIRHIFGAGIMDYRGLWKNPGE